MAMIEPIEDLSDPTWDPHLGDELFFGTLSDPYPILARLRESAGVVPGDFRDAMGLPPSPPQAYAPHYMVLSFAAIDHVLSHPEVFSNKAFDSTLGAAFGHTLSVMDQPEHTGYRKTLQRVFRPNIVQEWGTGIVDPVIDELVGAFRENGRAELVEQFCRPYPFTVIYRMIGLPARDIATFYRLTVTQILSPVRMDMALEASAKLGRYFTAMLAERRRNPGTDLVSVLATAETDGERLPDDVVISFLRQLINAGGDTTFRTTTILLTGLLTNPDQLEAVRADRSLIGPAIEEALRWDGPVVASMRETIEDTVVEGVPIPSGTFIDLLYGAANHDPAMYEHPERFDIFRARRRHFGFSSGIHNCIGQQLARLEMTRAVNAILDRLPNVRLDPEAPAPQPRGAMMRTPPAINVVFD